MTNPAVGDEKYISGDANTDGSTRFLWVADTNGDGLPDAKLQARVGGAWLDMVLPTAAATAEVARATAAEALKASLAQLRLVAGAARPANNRVMIDGDSRGAFSKAITATSWYKPNSLGHYIELLTGGRVTHDVVNDNLAVPAQSTRDLALRTAASVANGAGLVVLIMGTNDRVLNLPLQNGADPTGGTGGTIDNLSYYLAQQTAAGKIVIIFGEYPRDPTALTAQQVAYHIATRQWIRTKAPTLYPNVYVADPWGTLTLPASVALAQNTAYYQVDGIHLSQAGDFVAAQAVANIIDTIVPPVQPAGMQGNVDVWSADNVYGNLLSGTDFTGTAGSVGSGTTGTTPTGWNSNANGTSGLTLTLSRVANGAAYAAQVAASGTSPAGTPNMNIRVDVASPGSKISAGDVLRGIANVDIDAGSTGVAGASLSVLITVGGTNYEVRSGTPNFFLPITSLAHAGPVVTPDLTVPAGSLTLVRYQLVLYFVPSVAVSGTVRWAWPQLRKVL